MQEFSPDEARRWNAWQQAGAVSARRSELAVRRIAVMMLTGILIALAVALWPR